MKFVFLYRGGNAPEAEQEAYMGEWGAWIADLTQKGTQKAGLPFASGRVVTKDSTSDYEAADGDVNGYSEIEAASLDEAVEIAKSCPNQKYGGTVEVREAMNMPGM